jgi:hypothetical protein
VKLPNAENAVVDIAKIRDYSLNPDHREGKHKARVFQSKLGITRDDAEELRQQILEKILDSDAIEQQPNPYGRRFTVDVQIVRVEKFVLYLAVVRTAWIIRNDEDFPRLASCYILKGVVGDG